MRYLVIKKTESVGCDYSIGCGVNYEYIVAPDISNAIEMAIWPEGRQETSSLEGELALDEILIVPQENVCAVNVKAFKHEIEQAKEKQLKNTIELKELAEYERLKEKYGHST